MATDVTDLMVKVARMAREMREMRTVIHMLREDVHGLRSELGRANSTTAELMADSIMTRSEKDDGRNH